MRESMPVEVPAQYAEHVAQEVERVYWRMIAAGQLPSRGWYVQILQREDADAYRFAVVPCAPHV